MSRPSSRLNFWSVPPSSTSASHRHRVIALQQRVHQLEHRDRLRRRPALGEVLALQQLRDGRRAHQRRAARHLHVQPLAVAPHLQPLGSWVEDPQGLLLEGRRVGLDLLRARASGAASSAPRDRPRARCSRRRSAPRRWPASWNSRSLPSTTACPRWMSGAVGSIPSLTRSGRPSARSALAASPRARRRAGCRRRCAASRAASLGGLVGGVGGSRHGREC